MSVHWNQEDETGRCRVYHQAARDYDRRVQVIESEDDISVMTVSPLKLVIHGEIEIVAV